MVSVLGGSASRPKVEIRVAGCGDAFGSGGRFQACFVVDDHLGRFALDFGATSLAALDRQAIDPDSIDLVLVSHMHGDHVGGLPFLLLHRAFVSARKGPLTIAGPPGFEAQLRAIMESLYPGSWGVAWRFSLRMIELEPDREHEVLGRRIFTRRVKHSAGSVAATGMRIETAGVVIAYSGDSGWTGALAQLSQASDVFVCECNYFEPTGFDEHLSHAELVRHRAELGTARLVVTHLGPRMIARLGELDIEAAFDGMLIRV